MQSRVQGPHPVVGSGSRVGAMPDRSCHQCGAALLDRRRHAVYCGGACRAEASRERRSYAPATLTLAPATVGAKKAHRLTLCAFCGDLTVDQLVRIFIEEFDAVELVDSVEVVAM